MAFLRKEGVRVVWDCDDYIEGGPVFAADVVTVDTPAKRDLYPEALVVPDALDVQGGTPVKSEHRARLGRVVWVGNPENVYHAANVAEACAELQLEFVVITDTTKLKLPFEARAVNWSASQVDALMQDCDVAACSYVKDGPWPETWVRSKSANRLLKAWGLGLPVVGTPIPSYLDAGLRYQATTVEEWEDALRRMSDPAVREADARRGHAIAQQYRADRVAWQWWEVFERCTQAH
jgi:glycosyltransferase involved in cell wall biosynthesis